MFYQIVELFLISLNLMKYKSENRQEKKNLIQLY